MTDQYMRRLLANYRQMYSAHMKIANDKSEPYFVRERSLEAARKITDDIAALHMQFG